MPGVYIETICNGNSSAHYKLSLLIINALCSDQAGIIFNEIKCERNIESFFSLIPFEIIWWCCRCA